MQVIATDKDLEAFTDAMNRASAVVDEDVVAHSETIMRQLRIDARSPFLGKTMKEAGIRIPEDTAVIGFDDMPFCTVMEPSLSTIRVPKHYMGKMAVTRLVELIRTPDTEPVKIEINTSLIKRKSQG